VPRQLPAAPGLFAGRVDELTDLDRMLAILPTSFPTDPVMEGAPSGSTIERSPGGGIRLAVCHRGPTGAPIYWLIQLSQVVTNLLTKDLLSSSAILWVGGDRPFVHVVRWFRLHRDGWLRLRTRLLPLW